jgi:toxoflavin biosynthesis protein ToxD
MRPLTASRSPADGRAFRHWPVFDGALSAAMSDLQLMGLSSRECAAQRSAWPISSFAQLASQPTARLVEQVESVAVPLAQRQQVALVLACIGDPRLVPGQPVMQKIPGGYVNVGLDDDTDTVMNRYAGLGLRPEWIEKERPAHRVLLAPYRLAKYPVTNLEYRAFVEDTGYGELPGSWPLGIYPCEWANHPAYTLSDQAAIAYVRWLSGKTGEAYRLPTEAEWEHAAAGPCRHEFPWGDDFKPDHANTAESGLFRSSAVGMFPLGMSPYGCMDMAGNVEEYVDSLYAPYPGGTPVRDDLDTCSWPNRIARGGSFTRFRDLARTRRRHGRYARAIYVMGFRLALNGN